MSEIRFPISDLCVAINAQTDAEVAEVIGVTRRTVQRARRRGLSLDQAYEWCDAARVHPFELWPDLTAQAIEQAARLDEERRERRRKQQTEAQRRWRQNSPQRREKERRYSRDYYAAHSDYVRARERRRWADRRDGGTAA